MPSLQPAAARSVKATAVQSRRPTAVQNSRPKAVQSGRPTAATNTERTVRKRRSTKVPVPERPAKRPLLVQREEKPPVRKYKTQVQNKDNIRPPWR